MTRRKVPSSKGVSAGPIMTAFQVMTLSAMGEAETPAGGSVCIRYSERDVSEYIGMEVGGMG